MARPLSSCFVTVKRHSERRKGRDLKKIDHLRIGHPKQVWQL